MKVHATWRAGLKTTGRWSCQSPNLQQLPKPKWGKKDGEKVLLKRGLRPLYRASPGLKLCGADWKALEVRWISLLAGDTEMIKFILDGGDPHDHLAKAVFGPNFNDTQRTLAKNTRFARYYFASPRKILKMLKPAFPDLTEQAAEHLCTKIDEANPKITEWRHNQMKKAKEYGFVESALTGRRYYFYQGQVEPAKTVNFPIQSSAADLCNHAVEVLDDLLDWDEYALLLQCHDELVLEGPDINVMADYLTKAMQQELSLDGNSMLFEIDIEVGEVWGQLENYEKPNE